MITLAGASRAAKPGPALARRVRREFRRWRGALAAALVPAAVAAVLDQLSSGLNLTSTSLLFLVAVVAVARLGGMLSALGAALWASLLLNYYFVPPLHSATIANANDAIALAVFVVVALTVASVVDLAARQSRRAVRANAQAETLNALSLAVLRGDEALGVLLDQLRAAFHAGSVSLLQRYEPAPSEASADGGWRTIAASGDQPVGDPAQADTVVAIEPDVVLALRGRVLAPADRRVLSAFTAQANAALERGRLAESAAKASALEAADKMRTALLAAVSHDLRSPLSAARTAVGTMADPDLDLEPGDNLELLEIADESLARLSRLLEDLLDMSRLQAGVLKPRLVPLDAHDVLSPALESLPYGQDRSRVSIAPPEPDTSPVLADAPLLERVVANLVSNAIKYTDATVNVEVQQLGQSVQIRVADHGAGIDPAARDVIFRPFQRLTDGRNTAPGVGLGLALAKGLTESMGGSLTPADTPGGGLTMLLTLPAAPEANRP